MFTARATDCAVVAIPLGTLRRYARYKRKILNAIKIETYNIMIIKV